MQLGALPFNRWRQVFATILFAAYAGATGVWRELDAAVAWPLVLSLLVSAAWAANDLVVATPLGDLSAAQKSKLLEGPEPGPLTDRQRTDAGLPTFGRRSSDRTTLAAGAVLGATGAFAVGGLLRGIRTMVGRTLR